MPSRDVVRALTRAPRPRAYLDESVGRWVADVLNVRENVQTAEQAGLLGHADPDHFAYCWRHRRVLLTHDFDFFNYKNPELPDTRNPGVIVFNCDSRDLKSVEKILTFLPRFWAVAGDAGWRRTRSASVDTQNRQLIDTAKPAFN